MQRIKDCGVLSFKWDLHTIPLTANQGSLKNRGQKNHKSQKWPVIWRKECFFGHIRAEAHMNSQQLWQHEWDFHKTLHRISAWRCGGENEIPTFTEEFWIVDSCCESYTQLSLMMWPSLGLPHAQADPLPKNSQATQICLLLPYSQEPGEENIRNVPQQIDG
jgi:hypothetical protein